jgi:excisionase family DNA binding protein
MMLTRQQAANYFGVSLSTIQRLISARELEAIKVGRSVRISEKAIKTFMDRKRFSNEG